MSGNDLKTRSLNILLADDEEIIHQGMAPFLKQVGHNVRSVYNGNEALKAVEEDDFDLVLTDVRMPEMDGLTLLGKVCETQPELAVVIVTAFGDMDMVIEALRLGAADFLTKPVKLNELEAVIQKALRVGEFVKHERRFRNTLSSVQSSAYRWRSEQRMVGGSPAMERVRELIQSAVEVGCETLLVQGDTGTGKEVVAREIHLLGKKEKSPFIAVSCPALPETLVESELFGHVKGAFTGANADKAGCFELADGGTLFLDEVADLSAAAQAKLLRVLETRSVRRVGGKKEINVDVNVIAATNAPLDSLVQKKKFREDLFFRLNVFTIDIPPLRERVQDIMPLAELFLHSYVSNRKLDVHGISDQARNQLESYDYPGNVRELRNIIERAAILCRSGMIEPTHLRMTNGVLPEKPVQPALKSDENDEKADILRALEKAKWNRSRAAREMGISYAKLRYRMKKHNIEL